MKKIFQIKNFDTDGSGGFSQDEIDSITTIDFEGYRVGYDRSLKSLDGIEFFTSLNSLDCYHNQLTALDMSGNPSLQTLYCLNIPSLTQLNVNGNSNLRDLRCDRNHLTSLDIIKNPEPVAQNEKVANDLRFLSTGYDKTGFQYRDYDIYLKLYQTYLIFLL